MYIHTCNCDRTLYLGLPELALSLRQFESTGVVSSNPLGSRQQVSISLVDDYYIRQLDYPSLDALDSHQY